MVVVVERLVVCCEGLEVLGKLIELVESCRASQRYEGVDMCSRSVQLLCAEPHSLAASFFVVSPTSVVNLSSMT